MISVSIVDDEKELRESIATFVNGSPGFRCVSSYSNAESALPALPADQPDVVLMDINMAGMTGIECVEKLKATNPGMQIVMLTVYEDTDQIFKALSAGASGYLLKRADPSSILLAIQEVRQGGAPMSSQIARRVVQSFLETTIGTIKEQKLSQREEEILQQLAKGYSTKEIADRSSISVNTVRTHLQHIYEKLHVRSRTEAILKFLH